MFNHLFCDKVQIQKISGFGDFNKPIIEAEIVIKGKLEFENQKITNANGAEVISNGQLRLREKLNEFDRINVNGIWKEILNIIPQTDFNGMIIYYVVYF